MKTTYRKSNLVLLFSILTLVVTLFSANNISVQAADNQSQQSVKTYGAKGDGFTDDTDAIKSALSANVGKTLYFPAGTYIVSKKINIPSNSTIVGDGSDSIVMACEGMKVGGTVFETNRASNISISNIAISGNSEKNTREDGHSAKEGIHLLDIWYSKNISVKNCDFIDNIYAGIRVVHGTSDFTVDTCNFHNIDCGVIAISSGDIDTLSVLNSNFDGHDYSEPISLYGTGNYSNITIQNNIIQNKTFGCSIYCGRGTISNLKILDNELYDNASGIVVSNATNVEIGNNKIDFSKLLKKSGGGIYLSNSANVNIYNNNVTKTGQQGIRILNSSSVTVNDNSLIDCGYSTLDFHAMDLRGKCNNLVVNNNTFTRSDASLSECFLAINCTGTIDIKNNTFVGCKMAIYSDLSDVTITSK